MMKKIIKILVVITLICSLFVINQNKTKAINIEPYSFTWINRNKRYKDSVYKNGFKLDYQYRIDYGLSYNDNTYLITKTSGPTIVEEYTNLSTSMIPYTVYIKNVSVNAKISADKSSATYTWSFHIYVKYSNQDVLFATVQGSNTIKV